MKVCRWREEKKKKREVSRVLRCFDTDFVGFKCELFLFSCFYDSSRNSGTPDRREEPKRRETVRYGEQSGT